VVAVGKGVKRFKPGDRVYGFGFGNKKGGFFAEYAAVPESNVALVPSTISLEEAGALAVSGLTALEGLEELKLAEGKTLLLVGASGGVGHIALQLAKRLGLKVFAIASGDDGVALCKKVGADGVVDGKGRGDVADAARAFAPQGYDGALVLAAEEDDPRLQELTQQVHGKLAHPHGAAAPKENKKGSRVVAYDGEPRREAFERLNELVAQAPFHVEISKTYKLGETAQALRDVGEHHVGKLAVIVH